MPVDFAPGSRRTLSFLGISNASCQLHHLAILFRTIADLGRAMTYWGITLNFVKCLWPAKVWPKYLICKWRKTTSNMVIYFIRDYFLTASETGLKEVWSCKRFGKKKSYVPIINKHRVLGKKVRRLYRNRFLNQTMGCWNSAFDFWGSWHPIILVLVSLIYPLPKVKIFFTASHSSNPTKLEIEKQIGPL